ncbi:MAG: hypothetical protein M3R66_18075, partial [Actinomycetota bacterium]|nr:hypothetical protein [Actinomycetota bacterium]
NTTLRPATDTTAVSERSGDNVLRPVEDRLSEHVFDQQRHAESWDRPQKMTLGSQSNTLSR